MIQFKILTVVIAAAIVLVASSGTMAVQDEQTVNSTSWRRLFSYAGPLLPPDWAVLSVVNERVVIGFHNGTARNSLLEELEPKDRSFVQRLQNGTITATPLSSAKEKISQWSSSVTSTVSKFGKSVRDQFDSLVNNNNNNKNIPTVTNGTTIIVN